MNHINLRKLQVANRAKSIELLFGMAILVAVVVWAAMNYFGQTTIGVIPFAVGISLISVWGSYWASDKLVIRMTGAREIRREDNPRLFELVEETVAMVGIPMPKVAIVEDSAPNAFATGRDPEHALIAFTTGILDAMDREELQGVTAHELSHVANRDTLVSAIAATTAGAIAMLGDFLMNMMFWGRGRNNNDNNQNPLTLMLSLFVLILAPIAAVLLRSAISRKREALADATAVSFTKNPAGLRKALEVLARDNTVVQQQSNAVAHIWIESPLDGRSVSQLFSTHPPIAERIAILRALEANPDQIPGSGA